MSNQRFNFEKENTNFVKKLRLLFDQTRMPQQALIDFIKQKTGKAPTRQAVSMWLHGNKPDIETVPLIAEFFGVTTDYLLTDTKVATLDVNLQAVCKYTGLSVKSVDNLLKCSEKGLDANPLLESVFFETLISYLKRIKAVATDKGYYEKVVEQICFGEDFYSKLQLNDEKTRRSECRRVAESDDFCCGIEPFCSTCQDKDYIINELKYALLHMCNRTIKAPDVNLNEFNNELDICEFRATKTLSSIILEIVSFVADDINIFTANNVAVFDLLEQERDRLLQEIEMYKNNEFTGSLETNKAQIRAIEKFMKLYDENFNRKDDDNG